MRALRTTSPHRDEGVILRQPPPPAPDHSARRLNPTTRGSERETGENRGASDCWSGGPRSTTICKFRQTLVPLSPRRAPAASARSLAAFSRQTLGRARPHAGSGTTRVAVGTPTEAVQPIMSGGFNAPVLGVPFKGTCPWARAIAVDERPGYRSQPRFECQGER